MANLSFSARFKLWLEATRLLVGAGSAATVSEGLSAARQAALEVDPKARWNSFRPEGETGDGRWWIGHLIPNAKRVPLGVSLRLSLMLWLWGTGNEKQQEFAHRCFVKQHPEVPKGFAMAALDAFLSLAPSAASSTKPPRELGEWSENELTWLGYWACATDNEELFDQLLQRRPMEQWKNPPGALAPWLGWCTLVSRPQWLDRAIGSGMSVNDEQELPAGWDTKSKEAMGEWLRTLAKLDGPSDAKERRREQEKVLLELPSMGAKFNAVRWAVDANSQSCLEVLLYHGPDLSERTKNNLTTLDVAIDRAQWISANLLAKHAAHLFFTKEQRCKSLETVAAVNFLTVPNKDVFSELCTNLASTSLEENDKFTPHTPGWGEVVIQSADNINVCPALIAGFMQHPDAHHWSTWCRTTTLGEKKVSRSSLEIALVGNNATFLRAVVGQGHGLDDDFCNSPVLLAMAWFAPAALKSWLDVATPMEFKDAWSGEHGGITVGGKTLWEADWSAPRIILSSPRPDKALAILASHPVSAAAVKSFPVDKWAKLALAHRRVDCVEAVTSAFGPPSFSVGSILPAWASIIDRPRNDALIDRLLDLEWPVNIAVDKQGTSLILAAAKMMDTSLVERLAAHGADPSLADEKGWSLEQWLSSHADQAIAEKIRTALAEGQGKWMEMSVPEAAATISVPVRRL